MTHKVDISSGDVPASGGAAFEEITRAWDELRRWRVQGPELARKLQESNTKIYTQRREIRRLERALAKAEKKNPLNENDENDLCRSHVQVKFDLSFTKGEKKIKILRRNGTTLTEVSGPEEESLLPKLLRNARKEIRDRA